MAKDIKIKPAELSRMRANCALFGYAVGLGVGAFLAWKEGERAGRASAYKDREYHDLVSTVKNLTWEAQARQTREQMDKEAASGSAS